VATTALRPRQDRGQRSSVLEVLLIGFALGSLALAAPPLRVAATLGSLVHELGHAMTAALLGQHVSFVAVNRHGLGLSGLPSHASRWCDVLVLSAGYLAPPLVAAALVVASGRPRAARAGALILAAAIALGLVLWARPHLPSIDPVMAKVTQTSRADGMVTLDLGTLWIGGLVIVALLPDRRRQTAVAGVGGFLAAQVAALSPPHVGALGYSDAGMIGARDRLSPSFVLAAWFVVAVVALWLAVQMRLASERQSQTSITVRMTRPAFMSSNAWLIPSRSARLLIIPSRSRRPAFHNRSSLGKSTRTSAEP
jgi:hypothetical protein